MARSSSWRPTGRPWRGHDGITFGHPNGPKGDRAPPASMTRLSLIPVVDLVERFLQGWPRALSEHSKAR